MKPRAFRTAAAFRAWLTKNHARASELLVRIYKNHAAHRGMTNAQAVDEALCFGWIDGIRRALDDESFTVRFTPRKARSIWSRLNLGRAQALDAAGRMTAAGRAVWQGHDPKRAGIYSFERARMRLAPAFVRRLRANAKAWKYFRSVAPWYRRTVTHWIMTAKREETRQRRLDTLISYSERERPIKALDREKWK